VICDERVPAETLAYGFGVPEAPLWDEGGGLYFSDVRHGGVYHIEADARDREASSVACVLPGRASGGMLAHASGGLVLTGPDLVHVRDGRSRQLASVPGPGPGLFNDLTADDDGSVLAGTLRWRPHKDEPPRPGELWRVTAGGGMDCLYGDIEVSNGLALAGDTLLHADTMRRQLILHDVRGRQLTGRRVIGLGGLGQPDGMAVDADGGVWVAMFNSGRICRVRGESVDRSVAVPARRVTNLCFGGPGLADLFVLASDNQLEPARRGTVFRIRPGVAGRPVLKASI
jgi:sugar lactone lactonase YvrE